MGNFCGYSVTFWVGSLIWVAICALPELLIALGIVMGGVFLVFVVSYLIAIVVTLISDKNKFPDEDLYEDIDYEDEDNDE